MLLNNDRQMSIALERNTNVSPSCGYRKIQIDGVDDDDPSAGEFILYDSNPTNVSLFVDMTTGNEVDWVNKYAISWVNNIY